RASYYDRHYRQVSFEGRGESAQAKTVQARLGVKRSFREQREGFPGGRRLQQVSCIPGTGGGREPFHEPGTYPAQQEMRERHFLHFALDDEGEAGREESLQDQTVQVARM